METLGRTGRVTRALVTVAAAALVVLGSAWGSDDDFPFGPFLMYADARGADEPIGDTETYGVNTSGECLLLEKSLTGLRRAEIEGQLDRFSDSPGLLRHIAAAYTRRNPGAAPLRRVSVVVTWYELREGALTGRSHTEQVTSWQR